MHSSFEYYLLTGVSESIRPCQYYYQTGKFVTDWFPLATIRQITSTQDLATYDKYTNLKERVLDKIIKNINESDEFHIHLSLNTKTELPERKRGRQSVTHVRFKIKEKVTQISLNTDVRNSIVLSAQRAEIESLGVAKHAVDDVLNECADSKGKISLPFVKWTIRKAHEIKMMTKFSSSNNKQENNFGGYYRKNIVRARKASWFQIHDLLLTTLEQDGYNPSSLQLIELEQNIEKLKSRLKRKIAVQFISSLTEYGNAHCSDSFQSFLQKQLPHAYERYIAGPGTFSITTMAEQGNTYLLFYLDYTKNIFSLEAYQFVLSQE
jgi:hypothetical protein